MGPDDFRRLFSEATALKNSGDFLQAKSKLQQILDHVPTAVRSLHLMGLIEFENGDKREGIKLLRKAVEVKPNTAAYHFSLGLALESVEAVKCLTEAANLLPTNKDIIASLAKAQKKAKMNDQAEQTYRRLLELDPASAAVHYKLGHNMMRKRTEVGFKEAADFFNKAIELDPSYESAKYWGAVAAGQIGGAPDAPITAPAGYVQKLFDGYAHKFDEHLLGKLQYQTPDLLRKLLEQTLTKEGVAVCDKDGNTKALFKRCADLGCGTGLCGVAFQGLVRQHTWP